MLSFFRHRSPDAASGPQALGLWPTLGWMALILALATLAVLAGDFWSVNTTVSLLSFAATELVALALVVFAVWRAGFTLRDYFALMPPRWLYVAIGAACIAADLLLSYLISLRTGLMESLDPGVYFPSELPVYWLYFVAISPLAEEMVLRGFVYRGIAHSRLGVVGAIAITALVFAAIHLDRTWYGLAQLFVVGLVWGWLRWLSGSTLLTYGVHLTYNVMVAVFVTIDAFFPLPVEPLPPRLRLPPFFF